MAGRPRGVDNAVILRAAVEVIGRVGPARLTLAAVADEVGLVPGTLVQRFGSKRGLLLALAEGAVRDAETLHEQARDGQASALAALRAFVRRSWSAMSTPERYANHLAFLCMDLTDPEFHARALAVHEANGRVIAALLGEAVAEGALRAGTDAVALAGSIQAVTSGAGLCWALDRRGTLAERLERELDAALAPHLA
ncbi:TetR/AcrR family transcriptional regulator [Actinomadura montaniterrae]|uniref:TetR/AcrR family transcriptional regulator n=1 Tax=Actinomadura montaniterrae TaxID=1803903 RepID=A0A6L3VIW3_9ACTN|nr:TetR/AcrR family transcriptional regulator [Actinomadura montaniterrae]KAB2370772.1 TetR/AcrR family transcriptional regulator [Actinomadura montaniterrae]